MATRSLRPDTAAIGWRWALLGGLAGIALAMATFAPARWLAASLSTWSSGKLQLVNARGTVW
ncbi:MAG: type II secretion system protein N, partial [Comamonadaceae bacterium]